MLEYLPLGIILVLKNIVVRNMKVFPNYNFLYRKVINCNTSFKSLTSKFIEIKKSEL